MIEKLMNFSECWHQILLRKTCCTVITKYKLNFTFYLGIRVSDEWDFPIYRLYTPALCVCVYSSFVKVMPVLEDQHIFSGNIPTDR